ncbi:MAG: hypothetical protein GY832_23590 [Chloroflexi bacterium]|nr:hypothetical protein [Chloroflexota bacterium]
MTKIDCPYCDGEGESPNWRALDYHCPAPPMRRCHVCNGSGLLDPDMSDIIERYPTLREYEYAEQMAAAEAEWERRNER